MEGMVNILTERKMARRNALSGAWQAVTYPKQWVVEMRIGSDVVFVVRSPTTVKKLISNQGGK